MDASHDLSERVDQARLLESGGACDDSPSWNLGRAKQGDTIRVDGRSSRGRGQGASKCSEHKAKPLNESAAECTTKENDVSATRIPGRDESLRRGAVGCKTLQR